MGQCLIENISSTIISIDLDIDGVEHNNVSYKITFSSGEDIVVDTDE